MGIARFLYSVAQFSRVLGVIAFAAVSQKCGLLSKGQRDARIGNALASAFTRLAGLYIKFGQILAMRADLLPEEITTALDGLFDRVPAEPLEHSLDTIYEELGAPASQLFARFVDTPIAAASLATVYRAELHNGRTVAIKVQRRKIERVVRQDLAILFAIARAVDVTGLLKRFRLSQFVVEFARWTSEELDYEREARHMEYLRSKKLASGIVVIPIVEWDFTRSRILTMEFFDGVWLTDEEGMHSYHQGDRTIFAAELFASFMHDIFELGFFHADPHPGNLCILESGAVGLIDFGIIGFASELTQRSQSELLWAIQRNNITGAFEAVLRVLNVPPDADLDGFQTAFEENIRSWRLLQYQPNLTASDRSGGRLLLANFQAARTFGLTFKSAAVRYYRAFILIDAIVTRLDPAFNQIDALGEYFRSRFLRRQAHKAIARMSSFDLEMAGAARAERFFEGLERIVTASASDLISSAIDQTLLRISRIVKSFVYLTVFCLALSTSAGVLVEVAPDSAHRLFERGGTLGRVLETWNLFGISGVLAALTLILAWLSRILWITAYRGEQISSVAPAKARTRDSIRVIR